jgi:hypothetical protein
MGSSATPGAIVPSDHLGGLAAARSLVKDVPTMENLDPARAATPLAAAQARLAQLAATQAELAAQRHRALETGDGPGLAAADPRAIAIGQELAEARAELVRAVIDDLTGRLSGLIAAERAAQAAGPAATLRPQTAQTTPDQAERALAEAQATRARLLKATDAAPPWDRPW